MMRLPCGTLCVAWKSHRDWGPAVSRNSTPLHKTIRSLELSARQGKRV